MRPSRLDIVQNLLDLHILFELHYDPPKSEVLVGHEQMNQSNVIKANTPTGKLRASINLGDPPLATRSHQTTEPLGILVDVATKLAKRLETELELVVFDAAGKSVNAVES